MTVLLARTPRESIRKTTQINAQPFLKWVGGKKSLIPQLGPLFPRRFNRYFEPFLGGAAVFLHLQPRHASLSDINPRLIQCYMAVRDDCESVMEQLRKLRRGHSKDAYYEARNRMNSDQELSITERAALQIYLNKTCFNGLYRENRRGHFNVPFGRYDNPRIFDAVNIKKVSHMLRNVTISCQPFERIIDQAQPGDFVYLDPPYHPLSKTSNFTSFTRHGFDTFDQKRLAEVCKLLDRRGCLVMQSNSDTELIQGLYEDFSVSRVSARRNINSNGRRRGAVLEVVIRNYS